MKKGAESNSFIEYRHIFLAKHYNTHGKLDYIWALPNDISKINILTPNQKRKVPCWNLFRIFLDCHLHKVHLFIFQMSDISDALGTPEHFYFNVRFNQLFSCPFKGAISFFLLFWHILLILSAYSVSKQFFQCTKLTISQ